MSVVSDLIGGATQSSGPAPQQYNTWQPANTNALDTSFFNAVNQSQANNPYTTNLPYYQQVLSGQYNNPYASGLQSSANNAGATYGQVGNQAAANANNLSGASNQILNTAFDPQQALYNQQFQLNQDQTNANEAARGITNSGYGADLANQSDQEFNINWQNAQLGRQTQGLSAAGSGYGQAATLGTGGAAAQGLAGSTPYGASQSVLGNQASALANYGQQTGTQANALTNQNLSQMLQYLNLGGQQSNAQGNFNQQYWTDQNAYNSVQNAQNSSLLNGIGNFIQSPFGYTNQSYGAGTSGPSQVANGLPSWLTSAAALF